MTDAPQPVLTPGHAAEGKPAALIAWVLFILSIPSANLLVIVGLIVSYAGRGTATGIARQHIDAQIRLFWSVFWWTIALWVLIFLSAVTVILIPLAFVFWLLWFLLSVWFTVKSVLGLLSLLGDRPPA